MKLVLLPGTHGTASLFEPLKRALPPSIHTLSLEYPNDPALDYASLTGEMRRRLPAEDLVLLGESFGGPMAVTLAASTAGVRGLVLVSTFLRAPLPRLLVPVARALAPALSRTLPAWAIERYLVGSAASPALVEEIVREVRRVPRQVVAARLRALSPVDVRATFAALRVPTLIVTGGRDRLVGAAAVNEATRLRGDAVVLRLPDAPHCLLQTHPATVAEALEAFLRTSMNAGP
jgi:pimeloyl-ACP methyl ester carboxylesterase